MSNHQGVNNILANNTGQMGTGSEFPLAPAMAEGLLPLHYHQSLVCDSVQPKTSMNTDNSGLTYNVPAQRKRPRDSFDQFINNAPTNFFVASQSQQKSNNDVLVSQFPSLVGEQILPYINQYQLDIDTIISHHVSVSTF